MLKFASSVAEQWAACLPRILRKQARPRSGPTTSGKITSKPCAITDCALSGAADFTAKLNATSDAKRTSALRLRHRRHQSDPHRGAIAQVAHVFDENSAVCSVQNGVGNEEIIAEHVKYVIRGTTFPAGHPIAPGHIGFDIKGDTWIGPFEPTNTPMSKVEELAGLITRSGMNVHSR